MGSWWPGLCLGPTTPVLLIEGLALINSELAAPSVSLPQQSELGSLPQTSWKIEKLLYEANKCFRDR